MKKIVLGTLIWALAGLTFLSVAGTAMATDGEGGSVETVETGREFQAWEEGYEYTGYAPAPPPHYYQPSHPPVRVVPLPRDVRELVAEREMLKVDYHYYSLSPYPGNQARAAWTAERLADVEAKIEAWRFGYR